nr:S8 family peptidase [Sicyoidochytrium minutum DNA virus]
MRSIAAVFLLCATVANASRVMIEFKDGVTIQEIMSNPLPVDLDLEVIRATAPVLVKLGCSSTCASVSAEASSHWDDMITLMEDDGLMIIDDPAVTLDGPEYDKNQFTSSTVYSWGLDRIDGALDKVVTREGKAGEDVSIYVIDTGVRADHESFTGRVAEGFDTYSSGGGPGNYDCNGHGTHVASIAAGVGFGLADKAKIIPVRALGCGGSGPTSGVVDALEQVYADKSVPGNKKVVNLSVNGGRSTFMERAIEKLRSDGTVVVAAAGNANQDACRYAPGGYKGCVTVAATDRNNWKSGFSNWGSCVDINAPGSAIVGASILKPNGYEYRSGTSMATPYVAGVFANAVSSDTTGLSGAAFEAYMVDRIVGTWADPNVVGGLPSSTPNYFLRSWGTFSTQSPTACDTPTKTPTMSPTRSPSLRPTTGRPSRAPTAKSTGPDCDSLSDSECSLYSSRCRTYPGAGCQHRGFCGFPNSAVCSRWSYCRWMGSDGCQHKAWCGVNSKEECDKMGDMGCVWIGKYCRNG